MKELSTAQVIDVHGGVIAAGPLSFFVEFFVSWGLGEAASWGYHHPDEAFALAERGSAPVANFYANHPMAK